jgi:hypothetical protein
MEVIDRSLQTQIDKGSYRLVVVFTSFLNFIFMLYAKHDVII